MTLKLKKITRRNFLKRSTLATAGLATFGPMAICSNKIKKDSIEINHQISIFQKKYVKEPSQKVNIIEKAEVIICGGGPTGIMAALASARHGVKTILIEKYGFLGGMATAGLVGPISKFKLDDKWIVGGIPKEFIFDLENYNGAITNLPSGNIPFDPELYKYRALEMLINSDVKLFFHSKVVSTVESNKESVSHVILETPSGRQAVQGKYFIDCTGTGDLISQSSLPWKMRSETDKLQPMTLFFRLGGVDTDKLTLLMAKDGAVLPVPVCAMPSTSRPSSAEGIASAWIGVGVSYPAS